MISIGVELTDALPIAITVSDETITTTSVRMSLDQARITALLLVEAVQAADAYHKETAA